MATNKIYLADGTTITWTDTGGTYAMDMGNLAAAAVRAGAQGDLGASPRPRRYYWSFLCDGFTAASVVGETVLIYLAFGRSTTDIDGALTSSDVGSAVAVLPNLKWIGTATVQTTVADDDLRVSGEIVIPSRYVTPVVWNNTTKIFKTTSDTHIFRLTPIPPDIQAAA